VIRALPFTARWTFRLALPSAFPCFVPLTFAAALPDAVRARSPEVTATLAADVAESLNGPFVAEFVSGDTGDDSFSIRFRPPANFDGEREVAIGDHVGGSPVAERRLTADVDTLRPRTILAPAAGVTEPVTAPFGLTLTFDEPVTGLTPTEFVVADGEVGGGQGSGHTSTAIVTPMEGGNVPGSGFRSVDVRVNAAAATGAAGPTVGMDDLTVPIARLERVSGPPEPVMEAFEISIAFSETVKGLVDGDLVAGNGAVSDVGPGDTVTDMSSHVASITPNDNFDGDVTIDSAAGRAQSEEPSGTGNVAAQLRVAAETAVPASATRRASGGTEPVSGPFDIEKTCSQDVRDFAVGDITVGDGTASAFSGGGTTCTATITPSASGAVTADVATDVAEDAAGNGNTAATQLSVTADLVAPTVTLARADGLTTPVNGAFDITVTFSESVTGFTANDLTVGTGSAAGFAGSGASHMATITPRASGAMTMDVAANAADGLPGNGNTAAVRLSVTTDLAASLRNISYFWTYLLPNIDPEKHESKQIRCELA